MELFSFKKLVGILLMPLPISTLLIILAVVLLINKKNTAASIFGGSGLLLLLLSTTPWLPDALLGKIEKQYPQFDLSQPVSHIVVLGCSHVNDGTLPITAQVHPCSVVRVNEAMRILEQNPNATVITSGASSSEVYSNAEMNKRLMVALGVDESKIVTITSPKDTYGESRALAQKLRGRPFALVTAASHMPRSVRLFENQNLHPIPAPTAHLVRRSDNVKWLYYLPNSRHTQKLERWWYETLGQTWISIRMWWAD